MIADEKEQALKEFIKTINESEVAVFCIMDYWTFDWCVELKNYIQRNPNELKKTILFWMELRVECPVDYRLNIHVILSDKTSIQELNDFKSELEIRIWKDKKKLSNESLVLLAKSFDESKAKVHGYRDPKWLSDEELLELWSKTAEITKDSLTRAFSHIPKDSGFILLPYDTSDWLLELDWKKHPQADNYFMQTADIFESRDSRNVDLFLWRETDENKEFFENFYKTLWWLPKPCISWSDAHSFSNYWIYPSEKITWIKADPTFEWLKQIIYEPIDRVRIQELKPEEKEGYRVIDRVRFEDEHFMKEELVLNQNLNVIIGSRSSGKSTLLSHIANTIDSRQVMERGYEPLKWWSNFKVYWKDGEGWNFSEQPENRWIVYIPQNHINRLADSDNEKSEILWFIEKVLFLSEGWSVLLQEKEKLEQTLVLINGNIKIKVWELFWFIDSINKQKQKIKAFWDKKGVTEELGKVANQIKSLNTEISEDELRRFNEIMDEGLKNKQKSEVYKSDLSIIRNYYDKEDSEIEALFFRDVSMWVQDSNFRKLIGEDINILKGKFITSFKSWLMLKVTDLIKEITEIEANNAKLKEDNKILLGKWMKNKTANDLEKNRQKLKEKLLEIEKEEKNLLELIDTKNDILNQLVLFSKQRTTLRDAFAKQIQADIAWIKYSGLTKIDVQKFETFFDLNISYHYSREAKDYFNKIPAYTDSDGNLIKQCILGECKKVLELLLEEDETKKLKIKSSVTLKAVVEWFLEDYEYINYSIEYEEDNYREMTPGKKALVVLKLLIESSPEQSPILIDQPEDDLDSRSIYTDISNFLRQKKQERQIIIVTHNANIAVWADAEEVIVANRHGVESPNPDKTPFCYISGSIESSYFDVSKEWILYEQGIQWHACSILEWWEDAFKKRKAKYNLS